MTKEQLVEQRAQLVIQRAALKDQVDNLEKALGQINFAVQVIEAQENAAQSEDKE